MARFNVTYEIVTQESAEQGDAEERGFISQDSTLRDAIADLHATRTSACGGVEAIESSASDIANVRWFTVYNGMEYESGATESRSLHVPDSVTTASRKRIARLIGVRGF